MDVYTRAEVENLWRLTESGATLLEMLVNWEIAPAFRYDGRAIAEDREKGTQTEVGIEGVFYLDHLLPGIQIGGASQFTEYIEVNSFCASPDSKFTETKNVNVDMDSFRFGGFMVFKPLEPKSVHIDDVLITDDELKRAAKELGLPQAFSSSSVGIDTRERENLLKLIGVLLNIIIGIPPDEKFTKGGNEKLNIEKVVQEVLGFVDLHGLGEAGLSSRNLHKKVTEALNLLDDLKSGVVRR